jgi:hypothetical protein
MQLYSILTVIIIEYLITKVEQSHSIEINNDKIQYYLHVY